LLSRFHSHVAKNEHGLSYVRFGFGGCASSLVLASASAAAEGAARCRLLPQPML
jgi:hypothetical protein